MTAVEHLAPVDPAGSLNRARRDRDRAVARQGVDVVVVGGGITGAGVALDAAARGLSVVLVERGDLANGTSRWSSKLVHGGLRYLAHGDIGVAWESAAEREILAARLAPHLIRPLAQVVPEYQGERAGAWLTRIGYAAGDAMRLAAGSGCGLRPAHRVSPAAALSLVPGLARPGLLGAVVGWDCQLEDDARLVLAVARTAAAYGARILTRTSVSAIDDDAVAVSDACTGETYEIPTRWVVNATGVWAGTLDAGVRVHPSLGSHVVVPTSALGDGPGSLTVPVPGEVGRFVFSLPQPDGLSYLGLTDHPADPDSWSRPQAPAADVEWILQVLNAALARPLTRADVVGSFAGLRPLVSDADDTTGSADISRRHLVRRTGSLVTVTGGKLTTYRRMAQDAVDQLTDVPCRTRHLALVGAGPAGAAADVPARLVRRYGTEADAVWQYAREDRELADPIAPGFDVLGAEAAFAIDHEGALTVGDIVHRRTRAGLLTEHAAFTAAVADRFGDRLTADAPPTRPEALATTAP